MKKIIYITLFLSVLLFFNIIAFFVSSDYRFFLKKIKYWDTINANKEIITDEYTFTNEKETCNCENLINECEIQTTNTWETIENNLTVNTNSWEIIENSQIKNTNSIDIDLQEIEKFSKKFSWINFNKKNYNEYYKIFWITDEYLNKYLTLNSSNIEIYYFPNTNFLDLYNFFEAVSYDSPININRIDNFWNKSFYINLDNSDDFVRIIFETDNKIFGLKMKKNYYNSVKNVLNNL